MEIITPFKTLLAKKALENIFRYSKHVWRIYIDDCGYIRVSTFLNFNKNKLANAIKNYTKHILYNTNCPVGWSRDNFLPIWPTIPNSTYAHCYYMYEKLLERNCDKKYPTTIISSLLGENTCESIENEITYEMVERAC